MVSQSTLKRIKRFEIALEKLKRISKLKFSEYDTDTDKQDIAERNLQIATEAIVDIGQRIISLKGWEIPETYKDVINVLERNKVIEKRLSERMKELVSMRNIIIHAYAEIKNELVYEALKTEIPTLNKVLRILLEFCEANRIDP